MELPNRSTLSAMRYTPRYALAFLLTLVAGFCGAFLAWRAIQPPDLSQVALPDADASLNLVSTVIAAAAPIALPRAAVAPSRTPAVASTPTSVPQPVAAVEAPPPPTSPPAIVIAPPTPTASAPAEAPSPTPDLAQPTSEPTSALAELAPAAAYPFQPAGPVRHTTDGCASPSIRGTVYDAAGAPLAGVRLWLYDQWANTAYAETKSGAADFGQYDFPIFTNDPIIFYIAVLAPDGTPASPTVEVYHRQGPQQAANCHWLDWRRSP